MRAEGPRVALPRGAWWTTSHLCLNALPIHPLRRLATALVCACPAEATARCSIINVGDTGEQDLLATIAGLDNAINNTSLIFTLEVGDDVLLLPGDAQWGPWQAILGNADTVALINRTTFYKVSHPRQLQRHSEIPGSETRPQDHSRNLRQPCNPVAEHSRACAR